MEDKVKIINNPDEFSSKQIEKNDPDKSSSYQTTQSSDTTKTQIFSQDVVSGAINQRHLYPGGNQRGDMYYGLDGVRFTRLPIGAEGQILKIVNGVPTWVTP